MRELSMEENSFRYRLAHYVKAKMLHSGQSITEAAREIGISRNALFRSSSVDPSYPALSGENLAKVLAWVELAPEDFAKGRPGDLEAAILGYEGLGDESRLQLLATVRAFIQNVPKVEAQP